MFSPSHAHGTKFPVLDAFGFQSYRSWNPRHLSCLRPEDWKNKTPQNFTWKTKTTETCNILEVILFAPQYFCMNLYFSLYCADFIICLDIALDLYVLWSSGKCSALNACVNRVQKLVTSYDKLSTKVIVVSQFPPRNKKRGKDYQRVISQFSFYFSQFPVSISI